MKRDFTYIDDIIKGIVRVIDNPAESNTEWDAVNPDPATSKAPFRIFNIGRGEPISLMDFVLEIERQIHTKAKKIFRRMQDGDVAETSADVSNLGDILKYEPKTSVHTGVARFTAWYKAFYKVERKLQTTSPEEIIVR
jgi:UDP-glucuronate 4-epimerase